MEPHRRWILDLYPTPAGMAVRMVGQDGSRRCYFDNGFQPAGFQPASGRAVQKRRCIVYCLERSVP